MISLTCHWLSMENGQFAAIGCWITCKHCWNLAVLMCITVWELCIEEHEESLVLLFLKSLLYVEWLDVSWAKWMVICRRVFLMMVANIIDALIVHLGNLDLFAFACVTNLYRCVKTLQFAVESKYGFSSSLKNFFRMGFVEVVFQRICYKLGCLRWLN